ncbi:hypothetical protein JW933_09970 [candidate division FCPU426 bacterium]|nr:hypothetical protein [candidate division FCPU426 bacterium]
MRVTRRQYTCHPAAVFGFLFLYAVLWAARGAAAVAFEKYLLVVPLLPANAEAKKDKWFGAAFRLAWEQTALSLQTVVFPKEDELRELAKEYGFGSAPPEPGQMERVADEKDIAILYGTYQIKGSSILLECRVVPGRNFEGRAFKITGQKNRLQAVFREAFDRTRVLLDLTVTPAEIEALRRIPGTDAFAAYRHYWQAMQVLAPHPQSKTGALQALPLLDRALQTDKAFVPALATRANCRLMLAQAAKGKTRDKYLQGAKTDLEQCSRLDADHPLSQNAQAAYYLQLKKYAQAREIAEKNLSLHPANYRNYLLLAQAYRFLKMNDEAEKILLQGLDQQGTEIQKKPFNRELGLLLLKRNDQHAEVYLERVLKLEPRNARLYYFRAGALFRLRRYLEVMAEIQKLEAITTWQEVRLLKAKTALVLGQMFYGDGDFDRAYSYASIAMNIRTQDFETLLLMAKALKKKGLAPEARKQLEAAQAAVRKNHPKDHLWLGTEFVAQGYREEGAKEYILYLKRRPKAPERRRLISLIRQLQGDLDE